MSCYVIVYAYSIQKRMLRYVLYVDNIEVYIMSCYTCTYIRTVCYIVMYQYEVYTVFTRMYMYAVLSCIYVHVIMSLLYNIYLLVRIYTCSAIIEGLAVGSFFSLSLSDRDAHNIYILHSSSMSLW